MENKPLFKPNPKLKIMDQVREVLRYYHYAYRTEQTYCKWIMRYIRFFEGKKHPKDMGKAEIERFLSHLATVDNVAASTQNQAIRIPKDFELPGDEAIIRKEGAYLIIKPVRRPSLLALLSTLEPLDEDFPDIDESLLKPDDIEL